MNVVVAYAALCGILSAVLLGGIAALKWVGVLLPFVPLLPILWVGLTRGVIPLAVSAGVAFILSFLVVDTQNAFIFGLTQLVASVVFVRELMKLEVDEIDRGITWAPAGHAFAAMCLAAAVIAAIVMIFADESFARALAAIQRDLTTEMPDLDPEMAASFKNMITRIPHIFLALELWVWGLLLYGFAAFANFAAVSYRRAIRPSIRIEPFLPQTYYFISLMLVCLGSFLFTGPLAVFCQMSAIMLLFTYFMVGIGYIQARILTWNYAQVWMFIFIFFLLFAQWPVFFITLYGLILHGQYFWRTRNTPLGMA